MAYRARPKTRYRDPHFWVQVRSILYCALGDHQALAGTWVRQRRGDVFRRASCEDCLRPQGITRPNRPFTSSADEDAVDVRAKRVGGDE